MKNVFRCLDRKRIQFDFLVHQAGPGDLDGEIEDLGGRVLLCERTWDLPKYLGRLKDIMRQGRYDAVHSHVFHFSGLTLRVAHAAEIPVRIAHAHNTQGHEGDSWLRKQYARLMKRWISRHATHGLACSSQAAQALFGESWDKDARFRVLPYGIDLSPYASPILKGEGRRELGIPEQALVIGHVGRFVRQKNHAFLVEVFASLRQLHPDAFLLLVGDGPLKKEIADLLDGKGLLAETCFAGVRPDVPSLLMGGVDVFVFPSLWEGFGIAALEAQAAGVPCVVSDRLPQEIVVAPDWVKRMPLDAGACAWAHALLELVRSVNKEHSCAMQRVKESDFNLDTCVAALDRIYRGE